MLSENRTALGAYVAECFSVIVEEQHRLAIGHIGLNGLDQVVGIAVVIVIEELEPPAAHQARCCADAGCVGLIIKSLVVVVLIERILFVIDVGDEEVQPSILVEVGGYRSPGFSEMLYDT